MLKITETEPTPLVRDFSIFVAYLKNHRVTLTVAQEFINGRDLYELNQNMTSPVADTTSRTQQILYPMLQRKIEMSAKHTLLDLHNAIQLAYEFEDDHLFCFFMDGEAWSDERFASPYDDEGPYVDEAQMGELGLSKGQHILYLFDYGDEWRFDVVLEEIRVTGSKPRKPKVIASKGKAPDQYDYFEE